MLPNSSQILNKSQLSQKLKRLAYQVYEENFQEEELFFAGIKGGGYHLAGMLVEEFKKIAQINPQLLCISLDKLYPVQSEVEVDINLDLVENKSVIIVDDVLNTGRTLAYSLKPFLNIRVKKLQTLILVDRKHHSFPISADFVGFSLATTLQERIEVILDADEKCGVYLY